MLSVQGFGAGFAPEVLKKPALGQSSGAETTPRNAKKQRLEDNGVEAAVLEAAQSATTFQTTRKVVSTEEGDGVAETSSTRVSSPKITRAALQMRIVACQSVRAQVTWRKRTFKRSSSAKFVAHQRELSSSSWSACPSTRFWIARRERSWNVPPTSRQPFAQHRKAILYWSWPHAKALAGRRPSWVQFDAWVGGWRWVALDGRLMW